MNFPYILYPKPLEKIVISDFIFEATELMFDRFYRASEKNSIKKIILKPTPPSYRIKAFYELEEINIFGIICLVMAFWLVVPVLIVVSLIESAKYVKNFLTYIKANKNYKRLLNLGSEYIDYQKFYFSVSYEFNKYLINADPELEQTKQELKSARLKEITEIILKPTNSLHIQQKGISESFFADRLRNYFDFFAIEIITDGLVGCFFPDIILQTKTGLYIDIEIDEPYVGNTKEVIHYYETESNFYCDGERNNFFLESGWIIIRFSEKQIIKNSLSCCYEVALVLTKILNIEIPEDKIQQRLIPEKFWSRNYGQELANSNYRNSYLPNQLVNRFSNLTS